jgi:hypothetical protein
VHDSGRDVAEVAGAELADLPRAVVVEEDGHAAADHVKDLVVGAVGVRRNGVALRAVHGERTARLFISRS